MTTPQQVSLAQQAQAFAQAPQSAQPGALAQFLAPSGATQPQAPPAWQAPPQAPPAPSASTAPRAEPPAQFVTPSMPIEIQGTFQAPGAATSATYATLLPQAYTRAKAASPPKQGRAGKARAGPKGMNWTPEKAKDFFGKGLIFRARPVGTNYARISSLMRLFKVSALDKINVFKSRVDGAVATGDVKADQAENYIKLLADQALRDRLNVLAGSIGPEATKILFGGPQSIYGKWPYIALSDFVLVPHIATGGDYATVVKVLRDYALPRGALPVGLDGSAAINISPADIEPFVAGAGIGIWNVNLSTAGKSIRFPLDSVPPNPPIQGYTIPVLTTIGQVQAATQLINFFKDRRGNAAAALNPGADDKRILAKKRNTHGWKLGGFGEPNGLEKVALALPYATQTHDSETKRTYNQPWGTKLHTKGGARPQGDGSQRVVKLLESNATKLMNFMIDNYFAASENKGVNSRGTWKNISMVRDIVVPYIDANGQTVNLSTDYVGISRTKNYNAPIVGNPWIGITTEDSQAEIQKAISRVGNLFSINSAVNALTKAFNNNQGDMQQFYNTATNPAAWSARSASLGAPSKGTRFYTQSGQLDRYGKKEKVVQPRTVSQGPTSFRQT